MPVFREMKCSGRGSILHSVSMPLRASPNVPRMSDVTRILSQIESGDPSAAEQLLPLVYDELRKLAAVRLAQEKPGQTLQATALVHDAYLRLVDVEELQHWDSRGHFFAAAAEAMRRILVDKARKKQRPKHGGGRKRIDLDLACTLNEDSSEDLLALDEVLTKFAVVDPIKAELVKLRFFAGMSVPEAANALGISLATAERYWTYARVWLYCELSDDKAEEETSRNSGNF
jgi:RNA polymerase sigma factor (TIGR02999 family)